MHYMYAGTSRTGDRQPSRTSGETVCPQRAKIHACLKEGCWVVHLIAQYCALALRARGGYEAAYEQTYVRDRRYTCGVVMLAHLNEKS